MVKLFESLVLGTALTAVLVEAQCNGAVRRREWHDLPPGQQNQFIQCVRDLYDDGELTRFMENHARMQGPGHGNNFFLLFHRAFLREFEEALASKGCTFGLPYLDSGSIYNRIASDSIWNVIGGNNGCVGGPLEGVQTRPGTCLTRNANPNQNAIASATLKPIIDNMESFIEMTVTVENGQHALCHQIVGGDMANLLTAALDPVFFLHHCYVDYLWANWQDMNNDNYYDIGPQNPDQRGPYGRWTNGELADYRQNLCYHYGNPSAVVGGPEPDPDQDPDATDDGEDEELGIQVPEEQTNGNVTEASEIDPEVISSFSLDPEKVEEVTQQVKAVTESLKEAFENGDLGNIWNKVKDKINKNNQDKEQSDAQGGNQDDETPETEDNESSATSVTLSMFAILVAMLATMF